MNSRLGENMEQLAALLQSAQAHAQADVQPELPLKPLSYCSDWKPLTGRSTI